METLISESKPSPPTSSFGRLFGVVGAICLFAPLVGLPITVFAMVRRFEEMSQPPPEADLALSLSIRDALVATVIGFGVSLLGICLVCIAIFAFRFTPPWLRSTLMTASVLWLLAFPVGTVIAVIAFVILVRKRHVFAAPGIVQ